MQVVAKTLFSSLRISRAASCQRSGSSGYGLSTRMTTISRSGSSLSGPFSSVRATKIPALFGLLQSNSGRMATRLYCDSTPSNPTSEFPGVMVSSGKAISVTDGMDKVSEFFRRKYEDCRAKNVSNGETSSEVEKWQSLVMAKYTQDGILADIFFDAFKLCASSLKVQEALGAPITFETENSSFVLAFKSNDDMILRFEIRGSLNLGVVNIDWIKRVDGGLHKYTSLEVFVDGVPDKVIPVQIKTLKS